MSLSVGVKSCRGYGLGRYAVETAVRVRNCREKKSLYRLMYVEGDCGRSFSSLFFAVSFLLQTPISLESSNP
jgi:hypothetical protein